MTMANLHQRNVTASRLVEFEQKLIELQANAPVDENAAVGHRLAMLQTQSYINEFKAQLVEAD